MDDKIYDVIIIGGGPAGLSAAIYTSRAFLKTLVFAGNPSGGQLMLTSEVENYAGFKESIQGPELIQNMREQSKRFGTEILDENISLVEGNVTLGFTLTTEENKQYKTKTIILATGASATWLGLESEQRLRNRGVSACATCDGFFFKGKEIAVVGGGDAAMEEGTFLTKFATKVHFIVRGDKEGMKASKIMQEKALSNQKIEFHFNSEVTEVLGEDKMTGLKLRNNISGEESQLSTEGLFVAIGHKPNTDFIKDLVSVDHKGYVVVSDTTKTSVEGIFVAGDVADFRYRQAISAAGLGCMAALDVEKYLASKE